MGSDVIAVRYFLPVFGFLGTFAFLSIFASHAPARTLCIMARRGRGGTPRGDGQRDAAAEASR